MPPITKPATRAIIDDFAQEIREKRAQTVKPSKTVINFRTDMQDGHERDVWRVPIEVLRYRKDNGRIASDVEDYEQNFRPLDETDADDQRLLAEFLDRKDPEKTAMLEQTILHDGQREPAIVTCDGFLINGNRRKLVMAKLNAKYPEKPEFGFMKAVILPGPGEEGGPPTLIEIEKIENRYQLQSDGKSEYYGFDRAISIRRKIRLGLSLEDQLRDDPQFANATAADLKRAVQEYTKKYLSPLECVDRYLQQFHRPGQYRTVATGSSDREGRWQAFIDYSNTYFRVFQNGKKLNELGILEEEIGTIEESAFDIIRLRTIPDMPKVHQIMRQLPNFCRTKAGKNAILRIAEEVDPLLPQDDTVDDAGAPLPLEVVDAKWAARNKQPIIRYLKKAAKHHEHKREKETPLDLLDAAYKKLTHDDMDMSALGVGDFGKARTLIAKIAERANELEKILYRHQKNWKSLGQAEH